MAKSIDAGLQKLLRQLESVVQDDPFGEISFGWRLRLSCEMKEVFGEAEGVFRTNCLAYFVTSELRQFLGPDAFDTVVAEKCTGTCWAAWFLPLPQHALDTVRAFLGGYIPIEYLCEVTRALGNEMEHITACTRSQETLNMVYAVHALCRHVAGWESGLFVVKGWYEECRDDGKVADLRDDIFLAWGGDGAEPYCYIRWVVCKPDGKYDSLAPDYVARSRQFWRRWLHENVPEVLGPIRALRKRFK